MEIRNDITFRTRPLSPSFGAIKTESAEETLRQVLSLKELKSLKSLILSTRSYENSDLILFGTGKKLTARIADNVSLKGARMTEHSPWPWENKYKWIKKMADKMIKRHTEVSELLSKQEFKF